MNVNTARNKLFQKCSFFSPFLMIRIIRPHLILVLEVQLEEIFNVDLRHVVYNISEVETEGTLWYFQLALGIRKL